MALFPPQCLDLNCGAPMRTYAGNAVGRSRAPAGAKSWIEGARNGRQGIGEAALGTAHRVRPGGPGRRRAAGRGGDRRRLRDRAAEPREPAPLLRRPAAPGVRPGPDRGVRTPGRAASRRRGAPLPHSRRPPRSGSGCGTGCARAAPWACSGSRWTRPAPGRPRSRPTPTSRACSRKSRRSSLDLRLSVTIEAIDHNGEVNGSAIAEATRSRTLPEGITLAERERIYDQTVRALLHDYNASQEKAIRQYLRLYLR